MHRFEVQDMTCGHCAATVEKAVKEIDPAAKVSIDLATKAVAVESAAEAQALLGAIREAGYEGKAAA